ncbi:hypothetical protein M9Y10_006806 [Tritrichomonas musculus]|uniref:Uncharacterized protein n=1 Tax=Tritrichomonas musculus TaxID=1915356 RepID=A0ABR2JG51_9EUKA
MFNDNFCAFQTTKSDSLFIFDAFVCYHRKWSDFDRPNSNDWNRIVKNVFNIDELFSIANCSSWNQNTIRTQSDAFQPKSRPKLQLMKSNFL